MSPKLEEKYSTSTLMLLYIAMSQQTNTVRFGAEIVDPPARVAAKEQS